MISVPHLCRKTTQSTYICSLLVLSCPQNLSLVGFFSLKNKNVVVTNHLSFLSKHDDTTLSVLFPVFRTKHTVG